MLGGGDDVAARRVDDQDSPARRRGHVDVVDSDSGSSNHAQLSSGLDDRGRHAGLAAYDKRVEVGDAPDQFVFRQLADHGHLAGLAQALDAVLGQRVGDEDLRHH